MDKWLKVIKIDEVNVLIQTNYPNLLNELYNYFSYYVDNYRFMPKYKAGVWDGKVHLMKRNGLLPIGLISYIHKFAKRDNLSIEYDKELCYKEDIKDFEEITNKWLGEMEDGTPWVPRKHQVRGAIKSLTYKRGILEHATSSGKSLTIALTIMYKLIKKQSEKCLILVPTIGLVTQMTSDLISYGVPEDYIGNYYGFQKDTEQSIIISTWQSIYKNKKLLKEFDLLFADECHGLKADVIRSVSENATNCSFRMGCTGSLPDSKSDNMLIQGTLGPVLDKVTAKDLMKIGQVSDIIIKIPYIFYPSKVKKEIKGLPFDLEKKFIEEYNPRNNIIKHIVKKHNEKDHNVLILADHIDHARNLFEKMKTIDEESEIFLVTGSETDMRVNDDKLMTKKFKPGEYREFVRNYVNKNKKCVIVASYGVFSTGISIKRLHAVVFASAGKSKIKILQSIGRGLRLHEEKSLLFLYDIGDNLYYSDKHLQNRLDIYTKSQFDISVSEIDLEKFNA